MIFPGARYRPVPFTGKTGTMSVNCRGWILHVVEGNGSPWLYFATRPPGERKVSTGWVSKTGVVEQYIPATDKPWAQGAGNGSWHAWETEGFAHEPLTGMQIAALARIHIWHGAPDRIATSPDDRGIGTHAMGGAAWGRHSCPGTRRAAQRADILSAVADLRRQPSPPTKGPDDVPLSDDDIRRIADSVQTRYQVRRPDGAGLVPDDTAIGEIWAAILEIRDILGRGGAAK